MNLIWLALVFVFLGIDRLTKHLAVVHLEPRGSIVIIEDIFNLHFLRNTGAAFGLLEGWRWVFIPVTSIVCVAIIVYFFRVKHTNSVKFSLVLILAGALGNFFDRLISGSVVDFLYFVPINFPVFNFADCCVVMGTFLYAVITLFFTPEAVVKKVFSFNNKRTHELLEEITDELTESSGIPDYLSDEEGPKWRD